jgi:Uma2 family endonuclease
METIVVLPPLLTSIRDGDKILNGRSFVIIDQQILFYDKESDRFVFTCISDEKDYTVDDYLLLPESAPYQLINGKLFFMAAPIFRHQEISMILSGLIFSFLIGKKTGKVICSPMDVHFDEKNVFQPDILFVSVARSSIIQKWIFGAPDFIVEILSKGTEDIDRTRKMKIYGKYNVIEYWIVCPETEQIEVYHNKNRKMKLTETVSKTGRIVSKTIEGFELEVYKIFEI